MKMLLMLMMFVACMGASLEPFRLTYFDTTGRAEKIRLLFNAANKTNLLVDNRITSKQWPSLKAKTPYGQLPILRHGKIRLAQTVAILLYVARELNLAPNQWDNAASMSALEITLASEDLRAKWSDHKRIDNKAFGDIWRGYAKSFEAKLEANKETSPNFFVGDSLGYADVAVYDTFNQIASWLGWDASAKLEEAGAPRLKALYGSVAERVGHRPTAKKQDL